MSSECARYHAIVKWFNSKSGFGFITLLNHPEGEKDMFVHITNLNTSKNVFRVLMTGEYVECECEVNDETGKEQAVNVTGLYKNLLMCESSGNKNYYRNYKTTRND